jgi:PAS domain S-box-containing protein
MNSVDALPLPALFTLFMRHSPAAAFLRDHHGDYLWVNEAYAALYGTTVERMVGAPVEDFDPEPMAGRYRALDAEVLASGEPRRATLPFDLGGGRLGYAAGYRFAVPTDDGPPRVGGVYLDITDLVATRRELVEARDDYRAAVDRAQVPVVVCRLGGQIEEANSAFCEAYGTGAAELRGRPVSALLADGEPERWAQQWLDVARGRHPTLRANVVAQPADGPPVEVLATVSVSRDADGRPHRIVCVVDRVRRLGWLANGPLTRPLLSPLQATVLERLAEGADNSEIAGGLHLSRQALDYHLAVLRRKLRATSRAGMVARGYALGLLDPAQWPPRVHPRATATQLYGPAAPQGR